MVALHGKTLMKLYKILNNFGRANIEELFQVTEDCTFEAIGERFRANLRFYFTNHIAMI